jgi:hypothetical protein
MIRRWQRKNTSALLQLVNLKEGDDLKIRRVDYYEDEV